MSTPEATTAVAMPPTSLTNQQSLPKVMGTLIRREFWEHRSLWIAPLIMAVLMVLTVFPLHIGQMDFECAPNFADPANRIGAFTLMIWAHTEPQYLVMSLVSSFYLMDCLYAERKDRSILFWKSLPVSDATTVLSKFLVGVVVLPLGVYVLAALSGVLFQVLWSVRVASQSLPDI